MGSFYADHCIFFPAMAGWFLFSSLLSTYNKYVFGQDHLAFPCPLLMTSIHFAMQWAFSVGATWAYPERLGASRVTTMSWMEWALVSIPCGLVTSGDIGLSNLSVVTLSLTFYTMVKASTPIFVLGWAYVFGIERITWPLIGVVLVIALGEFLTVAGEGVDFQLQGFLLCLSASMLSGARWTMVQLKLQTMDPPIKTTITTMRLLAPSMFVSLLLTSLIIERPWIKLAPHDMAYHAEALGLGILGASLAIAMILCEFYLIMHATAIILMIGGVIKEMITIFVGVTLFHDKLNPINMAGCFVVFLGVLLYKITFHYEKQKAKERGGDNSGESHNGQQQRITPTALQSPSYTPVAGVDDDNDVADNNNNNVVASCRTSERTDENGSAARPAGRAAAVMDVEVAEIPLKGAQLRRRESGDGCDAESLLQGSVDSVEEDFSDEEEQRSR